MYSAEEHTHWKSVAKIHISDLPKLGDSFLSLSVPYSKSVSSNNTTKNPFLPSEPIPPKSSHYPQNFHIQQAIAPDLTNAINNTPDHGIINHHVLKSVLVLLSHAERLNIYRL